MQSSYTKRKTGIVWVWQSWPSGERLPKGSQQGHQKSKFKCKRGDNEEGKPDPSETSIHSTSISWWGSLSLKMSQKVPFWNPDPLNWWSRPQSIARVQVDDEDSLGSFGQWFNHQCCDPRICRCSSFGCWSLGWPVWWYPGYKWFQRSILMALGLGNHKGSGGRNLGLWQRSSSPSCTRFYWIWVLTTGYSGYTHHQSDHQCDQEKWNWWAVSFPERIKDSLIVGLLASRTFNSEGDSCKLSCGSNWFEWGGQNN